MEHLCGVFRRVGFFYAMAYAPPTKGLFFMNTRKGEMGLLALMLAISGVVAFAPPGLSQEKKGSHMAHEEAMLSCAKSCSDCQRSCDTCATHCTHLAVEGQKEHMATLMSCQDCATFCAAASQIVSRGGPQFVLICECCAKACNECGSACEKIPGDKHMKACAEECRKCEKACLAMVKQTGAR